jgi:hypothetical protein
MRVIVTNVVNDIVQGLSEADCGRLLAEIRTRFTDWNVILPFACIVAKKHKLERTIGRDCAAHVFPTIFKDTVTMELFEAVFGRFVIFFDDRRAFFKRLLREHAISDTRLVTFGVEAPCEFFDVVIRTSRYFNLIDLLFLRWSNPVRGMLMDFLLYMVSNVPKQIAVDFERVFQTMILRIAYVGNCRGYIVLGTDDGDVLVISKDSGKFLWKEKCFTNPIAFVSVAPNGLRFIALSLRDKMIMWVTKGRTRDVFELGGKVQYSQTIVPTIGVWKGDNKVMLQEQNGQTLEEIAAPKSWRLF